MDATEFYSIIDSARDETGPTAPGAQPDALRDVLDELDDVQIAEFGAEYVKQLVRLNRWSIWGAGFVVGGGMSDDAFHYFRSWLIGKGRDAVEQALADPDDLGLYLGEPASDDEFENELLEYVAVELLAERGVSEDPRDAVDDDPDDEPDGAPFDDETVGSVYPALSARRM